MQNLKRAAEFAIGGLIYGLMEISWRGATHISMFIAGGICFCLISLTARKLPHLGLICQSLICALLITAVEFCVGVTVNLWLGMNVWDYSSLSGNILGQVCPQFTFLWCIISVLAIYFRLAIGRYIFQEEPYKIRILPAMAKRRTAE